MGSLRRGKGERAGVEQKAGEVFLQPHIELAVKSYLKSFAS